MPKPTSSPCPTESAPETKSYDGSIRLIIGPMFSGKTTELMRLIKRFNISKKTTVIIKYHKDTRYGTASEAISHDRQKLVAIPASSLMMVFPLVETYDVIGIDEGQFFNDLRPFCEEMANRGKKVIVAALDGTYTKAPFGQVTEMIPLCERVKKLSAVCVYCGGKASFSLRISAEDTVEVIGGSEKYCSVCRKCYQARNNQSHRITEYFRTSLTKSQACSVVEQHNTISQAPSLIEQLEEQTEISSIQFKIQRRKSVADLLIREKTEPKENK